MNADAGRIHPGIFHEAPDANNLVFHLRLAALAVDGLLKGKAAV